MEKITVNGKEYVLASSVKGKRESVSNKKYVLVRTRSAGVFAGYLKSRDASTQEVVLVDARRIWYWDGAASLSQLAMDGTSKPDKCKFPAPVDEIILPEYIEIIPVTAKGKTSIEAVAIWSE